MGAREKLIESGRLVTFDFAAPALYIRTGDRAWLRRDSDWNPETPDEHVDDSLVVPRAVRLTLGEVVQAAFPQGMGRQDGKIWGAWQELLDDEAGISVEVPLSAVEWLRKRIEDDSVKIRPALVQWREAVLEYIEGLLTKKPAEEPKGDSADAAT